MLRKRFNIKYFDRNSDDYQYLEKSKLPSYHFQKSLPRLPIPELKKSCQRYLAAMTPLLNSNDLAETTKLVTEFELGDGAALDKKLREQDRANKHTNYVSKPWFDMYLKDRAPLPLNYNPAIIFNDAQSHLNSQIVRATNLVISSLRFNKSLSAGVLSPEVFHLNPAKSDTALFRNVTRMIPPSLSWYGAYAFKAYPLDMSQYDSLFNSTRIPKFGRDILVKDKTGRHILVLRNGNFYKMNVMDSSGLIYAPEDILTCLKHVISRSDQLNKESVAILTATGRDEWASTRDHLTSISAQNADSLKDIDSAIFVLCLDDIPLAGNPKLMLQSVLHGDGLNRWFDKSFSLIVSSDGTTGLNFEHSWGDGVAVLRYIQEILKDKVFVDGDSATSSVSVDERVKKLSFTLDDRIRADLTKARSSFDAACAPLDANPIMLENFGKKDCKGVKLSPDSVMQLAFQTAYHKVYNDFVGTYESCSTSAFKHGRTETVRPNTIHTRDFALAFNKRSRPSRSDLLQLMQKCSALHGQLTKEAAMGEGFDRHLFTLRSMALESGKVHPMFTHPSYAKMNHNILSTSTLSANCVQMGGFGPVVSDGFGIGYNMLDDMCGAMITSYSPHRDGAIFATALNDTLREFQTLLTAQ